YKFIRTQKLNASIDEVWSFISTPANLRKITPGSMGFNIQSKDLPDNIHAGMIISYNVRPLQGLKMRWVSEITHLNAKQYFVDEQRIGPYAMWHHEHILEPEGQGVVMKDIISYQPPLGFLGKLVNTLFISKKLNEIFNYREKELNRLFNQNQKLNHT
ncbi:hypothetical protein ACFLTA_07340, partial [Bacteroidota bacterium]